MKKYKRPLSLGQFLKEQKYFVLAGAIVILALLTGKNALGADAAWVITAEGGIIYDSITYEHYMGGSGTPDSSGSLCDTCTGWTEILTVSDSLYHFYYLYFYPVGSSNPGAWGWFKQPSGTTGVASTITFPLRAYWPDSAIASRTRRWSYNGTGVTNNDVTATSTDSNFHYVSDFTFSTSELHNITVDLSFPGVDSSQTWGFQIEPTSLAGGSGITLPSSADLVTVYGWLRDAMNNPIHGAKVYANRVASKYGLGGSSPPVIVPMSTVSVETDTLGLFQMIIRNTGSYGDTTKGFYNFTATYGGNELFSIERMYIEDVDSVSIADTLANR